MTSTRPAGRGDTDSAVATDVDAGDAPGLVGAAGGSVAQTGLWGDVWRQLRRDPKFLFGAVVVGLFTVMAIVPQLFTRIDPRACDLSRSRQAPSAQAWFGYDVLGCDYYANVIHGARVSISIGLYVVLGALLIGLVLGAIAGFRGGWVDNLVARIADIVYGLPLILGAIIILYQFQGRTVLIVGGALLLLVWMTPMRLVRSSVIAVRDADYVQAARALGASDGRLITRHILPNALAPVLVYATISVGVIISAEATLSFLGVGLQLPSISWGLMISEARNYLRTSLHLLIFPSAFLTVTVLAFISLGDALRDALDPKLR
ncbi:ABC transporter permease [Pseudonocardia sp.]|uniref:ABC transporter permease n=1 Tax=Pseudonocardia sp. TaxID=60912 RepID=UPI0026168C03|nr:ABC transporter permease [Pseudonocardia sp.]